MMKLYLTREHNGLYQATALQPAWHPILTEPSIQFPYFRLGEPVGVRHLCPMVIKHLIGRDLEIGETTRIRIDVKEIGGPGA